jgi:hypothetical protein
VKFQLIATEGTTRSIREFETDYLYEVLPELEDFLRGAGFPFDGNLEIVDTVATSRTDSGHVIDDFDDDGRC